MSTAASSQESFSGRFVLNNRREEIELAEQSLLRAVEERRYDRTSVFAIRLALEEALNNAFKHGNKGDPRKTVRMECRVDPNIVVIDIEDQGEGFDPDSVPDPTEQENVEIPSGRGLTLMRAFMTEVMIHPPGNRVLMKFVRPS
jgi:serine/threonine-protein kinase RsbW